MAEPDRSDYEEAERLVREAQRAAEGGRRRGAAARVERAGRGALRDAASPTSAQLTALVESLRGVVPPELARQLADALRELLIALRAVLDWYIARLEPPEPPDSDVQDIPVE